MERQKEFELSIGEKANVRPGVFKSSISIVYAGMLNNDTYSIIVIWTSGYNSMAYNLYLGIDQKSFLIPKGRITVSSVTRDQIKFHFDLI